MRRRLKELCTSVEQLAWAKESGCLWGFPGRRWWTNPCAFAVRGGRLETLQWARQHGCPWAESNVVTGLLRADNWMSCVGRGHTTARGMRGHAARRCGWSDGVHCSYVSSLLMLS